MKRIMDLAADPALAAASAATGVQGAAEPAGGWPAPPLGLEPGGVEGQGPAFLVAGAAEQPPSPVVMASPHSGRIYPLSMMRASRLDAAAVRRSEDALVDRLIEGAPAAGVVTLSARYARAFIDLNREPYELDPAMFEGCIPDFARGRSARVAAGLGSIARVVGEGVEIYSRKLSFAEAEQRIEGAHRPYHAALSALLGRARQSHGASVLIDWHSMPSGAARTGGRRCDVVLGDRYGSACAPGLTRFVERELEAAGLKVARNAPYAGGFTTVSYGRPAAGAHALQVELSRDLYMDEATLEPTGGFAPLRGRISALAAALSEGWRSLL